MGARIRKLWTQAEEIRLAAGHGDAHGPLRKVAACAVVVNVRLGGQTAADVLGHES
jgi:hypothetical protein